MSRGGDGVGHGGKNGGVMTCNHVTLDIPGGALFSVIADQQGKKAFDAAVGHAVVAAGAFCNSAPLRRSPRSGESQACCETELRKPSPWSGSENEVTANQHGELWTQGSPLPPVPLLKSYGECGPRKIVQHLTVTSQGCF